MDQLKFVSVLIVNYNSGNYAKACIESLFNQNNITLEIIVVDNASADDSVKVLSASFGKKSPLSKARKT